MNDVEFLLGGADVSNAPLKPYSDEVCAFLAEVSAEIMKSAAARAFPDVVSLGFWCRKANIQRLKEAFGDNSKKLGRGLCFHIAPSNIPINFAFSCIFGMLAGNANIVRLPSKNFPQIAIVSDIFRAVSAKFPAIARATAFVKYPRESLATAEFSKSADARMIWGGDATVKTIKTLETKPRCVDVSFADRYSVCAIDAAELLKADAARIKRLSESFYNDTYLMDQNACSSPQLILWLNDSAAARKLFWDEVFKTAEKKYILQDATCVEKYTKMCENAADNDGLFSRVCGEWNLLYRTEILKLSKKVEEVRGSGGYFYEYALGDISELLKIADEKYQTLTYFGIDADALARRVADSRCRGIDRIVPIGEAMNIGVFWDGFDLINTLSRTIATE